MEEGISNLFSSLARGGDIWTGHASIADPGDGATRFILYLKDSVPKTARRDLIGYIKGYMRESGWKVHAVRVTRRYVEIALSNA